MHELRGRVAVVTGAASGIGAAMARRFAREGMRVVAADIDAAGAERVAAAIAADGGVAIARRTDVGDPASLEQLAAATASEYGGVDLLASNVGVQRIGRFDTLTRGDWEWVLSVNVLGSVETVRAFLTQLRASGDAHVLVTCSVSSLLSIPRLAAYTASKMALLGFAETLRLELGEEGIPVTAILPAGMATTHLQSSAAARPSDLGPAPDPTLDDVLLLRDGLAPGEDSVLTPEDAIRDLVPAIRENRPYLVTHAPNQAAVEQRFAALLGAFERSRS
jgi:NAD(P)-dependent dehydrogenase (short-subunit alcohol dehydrogenase family)